MLVPERGSSSASRAVAILQLLAGESRYMSLTAIAASLGLAKSSTLRLLVSLESAGLVRRRDNDYGLDFGIVQLAGGFLSGFDVVAEMHEQVKTLPLLRDEIIQMAVLMGRNVTFVGRHVGRAPLAMTASVGDCYPAANTSVGQALLAELTDAEVRELYTGADSFTPWTGKSVTSVTALLKKLRATRQRGYSLDEGETHPDVLGIGVAVHCEASHGQTLAVCVSLRPIDTPSERVEQAVSELFALRDTLALTSIG